MNVIEVANLRKSYDEVVAVDGIDLAVGMGEVVAVLGPNGAGKTTTIEMLLGLRVPTKGTVRVLGGAPASTAVRGRVGAMLQETAAPESLTVGELTDLVGSYYPTRLTTEETLQRAGLPDRSRTRVSQLSGGLRQRLSFALAIVGDPDLLFLDEPTAALDVAARRAFWRQVGEFAALGKTVLFSTHNLTEADESAERVVVIDRGRVVHDGTPEQVKRLVGGRTVELVTDLSDGELRMLTGVRTFSTEPAESRGRRRVRMQVAAAEPVLSELFGHGRPVEDLVVEQSSLEDAFVHLTRQEVAR